jgi:hypothetical protein
MKVVELVYEKIRLDYNHIAIFDQIFYLDYFI